ncbi:MAG: glycosyltransferase family 4 protein [Euryarchaeota archaeon]|nr:glycosyltransferase family 4 protein [Euryarchaeota archaeon]MDE1835298.1 glycosyltransferase family 4 protein [Euryarchaeota archaeon]MDE1880569.1 glycosyltransferase family 4 protein [Euryarchaeota archaeon]MDE2043594.1 glycosyltransferase family 4 protein [Thermoplasmata archaeon]
MRVLRINDWTGPPGGTESYLRSVGRALEAEGHPQKTVSITDAPSVSEYRPEPWEEVLPLARMGPGRLAEDLGAEPPGLLRLRRVVEEFHPDLVHVHHFDSWFVPLARLLSKLSVPTVLTAHDAKLVCPIATLVLPDGRLCEGRILPRCQFTGCHVGLGIPYKLAQDRVFRRRVAPRVKLFIAPSRAAAQFLERHGFGPTQVLAPFIDAPSSVETAPPALPNGEPTIGFLGRLETYKGPFSLLEAFAKARARVPGLRLILAGRGSAEPALRARARALGPETAQAVEFPGWVNGEEKERFFRRIHLLAVPSDGYENFGLVGLEAFVRGRPALGSHLGGIPDWLEDGKQGRLLPPGDVAAWSEAIVESFADRKRMEEWGRRGRERYVALFRPAAHVRGLLDAYHRVLDGPGK